MSVFVEIRLRNGQTPEEPFHSGQGIGQFADADECDAVAKAAGIRPLSDYYCYDPELIQEFADALEDEGEPTDWVPNERSKTQQWHDPAEGLQSVDALLKHFQAKAEQGPYDEFLEEVLIDLRAFHEILKNAATTRNAFRLEVSA